ncbi:unnamed protein product [Allacma fusca]|uniref:Ig-like domain-containing protein n=1 Tax=Allacma fusca TaxID=39272 RepID=A0A8J2JPY6_9HEXA|nr:unnamed protein product [Allacma fusca]
MMVKFKRWKLVGFLLFLLILFDTDFCCGRRTRQTESMLEDFDIGESAKFPYLQYGAEIQAKIKSSLPRFAQPIPNVTVTIGKDALLPCVVDNLRSYKVAWVRVDTQTILTIHQAVITRNPRITLSYSDHRSWFLQIKNTHESDRGWYMCQINTDPMRSLMGYLEVVGK